MKRPRARIPAPAAGDDGPLSKSVRPAAELYARAEADLARGDGRSAFDHLAAAINLFSAAPAATRADALLRASINGSIGALLDVNSDYAGARFRYLRQVEILADLVPADDLRLVTARYNAAEIARHTGDLDAAMAEFDPLRPLLAAAAPASEQARTLQILLNKNRGQALVQLGRWSEAEAAFDAALTDAVDHRQRLSLRLSAAHARGAQDLPVDIAPLERELAELAAVRGPADLDVLFLRHQVGLLYPSGDLDRRLTAARRILDGLGGEVDGEARRLKAVTLLDLSTIHLRRGAREEALAAAQQAAPLIEEIYAEDVRAGGTATRPVDPPWPIAAVLARILRMPGSDQPEALCALHRAATGYKRGQAELLLAQHHLRLTDPERSSVIDDERAHRSSTDESTEPDRRVTLAALSAEAVPREAVQEMFERSDADRVAEALPPGGALVEYVRLEALSTDDDATATGSGPAAPRDDARFVAFVVRADEPQLHFVDLGAAADVDRAATALLAAIPGAGFGNRNRAPAAAPADADEPPREHGPGERAAPDLDVSPDALGRRVRPASAARGDWRDAAGRLAALIWAPLADALPAGEQLFIAPDGILCAVPFDVLPATPDGPPLLTTRTLSLVGTGRDLVRLSRRANLWPTEPVVVAAPEYGEPPTPFTPLPGTAAEGEAIGALLDVEPLTGRAATRGAVLAARDAEILHLASHGYAGGLGPHQRSGTPADCGIALAGANHADGDRGAGVLTGDDVLDMHLSGTDLVVLSACDTQLGELDDYEGLLGLARAFFLGGARSVVSTLWRVDDEATADLMQDLYRRLLAERSRAWALADAKRAAYRQHPDRPERWAAFISTGDDGALLRFRWVMVAEGQLPRRTVDAGGGVAYVDTGRPMGVADVHLPGGGDPLRFMNINMRNSWLQEVNASYAEAWDAFSEGRFDRASELVGEVLESLADQPIGRPRQADALALAALCSVNRDDLDQAAEWGWKAVSAYRALDAWPVGESVALDNLGIIEVNRGRIDEGVSLLEQSLSLKLSTFPRDEQQIQFTRGVLADIREQLRNRSHTPEPPG